MKRLLFASLPLMLAGICFAPSDETGAGAPPAPPTPEQVAADKAAAAAAAKAEKEAKKAADAQRRLSEAAEKKAAKEAEAASKKAAKDAEKAAKAQALLDAKAAKEAEKAANAMPEQNGVKRPKNGTLCGQAWAVFDEVSGTKGAPTSIAEAMAVSQPRGLNDANVRAEYARWRKFHGLSGRIPAPKPVAPAEAGAAA